MYSIFCVGSGDCEGSGEGVGVGDADISGTIEETGKFEFCGLLEFSIFCCKELSFNFIAPHPAKTTSKITDSIKAVSFVIFICFPFYNKI